MIDGEVETHLREAAGPEIQEPIKRPTTTDDLENRGRGNEGMRRAGLAMIYAVDADRAARAWDLRPTDTGANVLRAEPAYPTAFARTSQGKGK